LEGMGNAKRNEGKIRKSDRGEREGVNLVGLGTGYKGASENFGILKYSGGVTFVGGGLRALGYLGR